MCLYGAGKHRVTPCRKFVCIVCGHIFDEAQGDPDSGPAPGTRREEVPADWCCPECGTEKDFYERLDG